jgi:exopolysaccharide biosynthesis protein
MIRLIPFLFLLLSMQTGVQYQHLQQEGPLSIHVLEVDPQHVILKAVHADFALENTSSLAKRHGALAAVNGGFYRMTGPFAGTSSGILKVDGKYLSSPRLDRAAIGWKEDGQCALIDRIAWRGTFFLGNHTYSFQGINQPHTPDKAILYTFPITGRGVPTEDGSFLFIGPEYPFEVPLDEIARTSIRLQPMNEPEHTELWNEMEHIVGGTPLLVAGGELITDYSCEKTLYSFLVNRHPRTAVGLKPDGHWVFVVVEGRQQEFSLGMTIHELATFMHSLGCTYALNLDGGGSSTLYFDGSVVNIPSGDDDDSLGVIRGTERAVTDAILILPRM